MTKVPDHGRFASLVEKCHADVWRSAMRVLGDAERAADVTQDVYMDVLEGRIDLGDAERPCAVLQWFAARRSLMVLRAERARTSRQEKAAMSDVHDDTSRDDREAKQMVRGFLGLLPEDLGNAVVLRFFQGLSFEAIAEATKCSVTTAHDRVRRGLERLEGELSRAGYAGAATGLAGLLTPADATGVPARLAKRLLALSGTGAKVAVVSSVALPLIAVAVVVVAAGGWFMSTTVAERRELDDAHRAAEFAVQAIEARRAAEATRRPPPLTVDEAAEVAVEDSPGARTPTRGDVDDARVHAHEIEPVVAISGRFIDDRGTPFAGVIVQAASLIRDGKMPRHGGLAASAADGSFVIEVPIDPRQPRLYVVSTRHDHAVTWRSTELACESGKPVDLGDVTLFPNTVSRVGSYEVNILVRDAEGRPVEGAVVRLLRRSKSVHGHWDTAWEAGGKTDAAGRLSLAGKTLGEKRLQLAARQAGLRDTTFDFGIQRDGRENLTVEMAPGLGITGTIRDVDGAPAAGFSLYAVADGEPNEWNLATIADDGTYRIDGLDERSYILRSQAGDWSEIEFPSVAAGTRGFDIVAKRRDDPRSHGMHLAELHGTARNADSGEPVTVGSFELDIEPLPDVDEAELRRDVLPNLFCGRLAQQMEIGKPEVTDAFHATGLAAGSWAVIFRPEHAAPVVLGPIRLQAGEVKSGLTLLVRRGAGVSGRVVDGAGRPVEGAVVFVTGVGPRSDAIITGHDDEIRRLSGEGTLLIPSYVKTDAQGRYAIAGLPAEFGIRIAACHPRLAPATTESLVLSPGHVLAAPDIRCTDR